MARAISCQAGVCRAFVVGGGRACKGLALKPKISLTNGLKTFKYFGELKTGSVRLMGSRNQSIKGKGSNMSIKLKALGLGLLAAMALSAVAVVNASATAGGHFISSNAHTIIKGFENYTTLPHLLEFESHGLSGKIFCTNSSYEGTTDETTETEITITPKWSNCHTTNSVNNFDVHENGCDFKFTVQAGDQTKVEHTVHVECPAGEAIEITHPNCNITVPPQTVANAVTFTPATEGANHGITLDVSAEFDTEYHGGICIFTGTNHVGTLAGSATVKGFNTAGDQQFNITST